ncbi:uncharacterized protein LOC128200485, partial [Galleria mellonella]|uniref:Uncharacterized protein LOC128200485 n=1 Tax=Galleria mellonella TaxID=7137 RepID=A0ABM3MFW2_GALME
IPPSPTPSCSLETASFDFSELVTEIRLLREEMKEYRTEMQEFRTTISNLTVTVGSCQLQIDALTTRVNEMEKQRCEGTNDTTSVLEQTISELKMELNHRDQELLCNDIEIAGIPEDTNERGIHLALTVAQKLGVVLEERDIVDAQRAGTFKRTMSDNSPISRPRPLVVRLTRRTHRDQMLAAARVRRDITTAGLGLALADQRIYVNERLTQTNRRLFYKARVESLRVQWKYLWTREGKIYVRKEHGSPRHRIRSENDFNKVFG